MAATGFESLDDLTINVVTNAERAADPVALAESKRISAATTDKAYRKLMAASNATSYSKLQELHRCPRAYELQELEANSAAAIAAVAAREAEPNLHFSFGHAVGAGIQTFAATQNLTAAQFAAFIAWKAEYEQEQLDKRGYPTGKSLVHALLAVEKFPNFWQEHLNDFELVRLPNGKAATELSFAVDFENGYHHFGHIDSLLRSRSTGKLAVWEGKTTGFEHIDEAVYANSTQALSYSVVVDAISQQLGAYGTDYEVLYIVYSSRAREFSLLPFGKTRAQRAEWLHDIVLDHAAISQYRRIEFFPKRGESCYDFGLRNRCRWFGNCTMRNSSIFPDSQLSRIDDVTQVENVDFKFTLSELLAAQESRNNA